MSIQPKALSILVDLSVLRHAVMIQPARIEKTISWGDQIHTVHLDGWERRPDLPPDQAWRQTQVECLPTIARLAREGGLILYSYIELHFEDWRGNRGMVGSFGDLFADIEIHNVPPAVERSRFRQTDDLGQHLSKDELTDFCQFLICLDPAVLQKATEFWETLPDFERQNLSRLDKFKKLCRTLTGNHYADAFHLWTAEANGLDGFLMVEKAFPNAVRRDRALNFRCAPVTPEELIQQLGVAERDPIPIPEGGPRGYFD